ncbi:MAG: hypothetical protein JO246_03335 [Frankiaceae bacterium]|nr:hypothetical protein [Frankiaceae bacterium]MBV9870700.1 hypothetical protein [Frankiaceae bacterium]
MSDIDTLVRDALEVDASTHHASGDLAARSMSAGRRLRRRRRAGLAATSLLSAAGVVVASLTATGAFSSTTTQRVIPPASGGDSGQVHNVPAWSTWPNDRVFGSKPGSAVLSGGRTGDAWVPIASGTMPDGMQFAFDYEATQLGHKYSTDMGVNGQVIFGEELAENLAPAPSDRLPYVANEFMTSATYDNGKEDGDTFWLVVVGQPATNSAEFSMDGAHWDPMQIEHGIAAVKVQADHAGLPAAARLRLSDPDGLYFDGPADLLPAPQS